MVNIELPGPCPGLAELRLVTDILDTLGIGQCMVTGGCLRDAFYKRTQPTKDIDIAVWGLDVPGIHALYDQLHAFGFTHKMPEGDWHDHVEPSEADAQRIQQVWQFVSPLGNLVDILLYTEQFTSWQQVVLSHDHSINMFAGLLTESFDGYDVEVWFPWHNMGRCYQMRDHVNQSRIEHIQKVCQELGIVYCITPEPHMEVRQPRIAWKGTDMEGNQCTLNIPYHGR